MCCCYSVAKLRSTLCDPMDCSIAMFPVLHYLPGFVQTHVHWVGDVIQLSYPQSSPSPSTFNLSQHQHLIQWVSSLYQGTKVLELQLQHQSFQWIFRTDFLQDGLVWSPCYPRKSQESSTIESVLMRWMKLEPIIQSEVSQKEKHQYSILTHIYGI